MSRPDWSRPLPRPLTIPTVMTLSTLADVRNLVDKHLPERYRRRPAWRHVSTEIAKAAEGEKDLLEICVTASPGARARGRRVPDEMTARRFAPPWVVDDNGAAFIVKDASGQALAYVYYEQEPGRRTAANLLTRD